MANFNPPFSTNGEFRNPESTERQNGFPCGPADQLLFNGMFRRIEAELGSVIDEAGITQTDDRDTLVLEAIQALIAAATGGNPAGYVLMSQARARLPIYPEVLNTDGRFVITAPSTGTIRIPGGVNFLHRGIFTLTSAQTDFPTDPSKVYHLRWNPTDGFNIKDLANVGYNPSALAESNPLFDSSYDDMLIARITTNSGNIATILNLANKHQLYLEEEKTGPATVYTYGTGNDGMFYQATSDVSWGRTPRAVIAGWTHTSGTRLVNGTINRITSRATTRYGSTARVDGDWNDVLNGVQTGILHFQHML